MLIEEMTQHISSTQLSAHCWAVRTEKRVIIVETGSKSIRCNVTRRCRSELHPNVPARLIGGIVGG